MTHINLVRHAETNLNADPRTIGGRSNHIEITDIGHQQGQYLQKHIATSNSIADILCISPAIRAKQTGGYVVDGLGYTGEILIDDRLQEIDQGDWTGKNRNAIYTQDIIDAIKADPWGFCPPNGESIQMVGDRMNELINEITKKYPDGYAWIVSHGVAIAAAIMTRFGMTGATIKQFPHSNTGITSIHYDPNPKAIASWRLLSYNNDSHLPANLRTIQLV